MFKDYYKILDIPYSSSESEIKIAYRTLAKKWHPDRNQGVDVKGIMQDINEAYAILKDPEKRERYDREYAMFQAERKEYERHDRWTYAETTGQEYEYDYNCHDNDLNEDIENARRYARDIVDEFFSQLKKDTEIAAQGAWEGVKIYVYVLIFSVVFGNIIFALINL